MEYSIPRQLCLIILVGKFEENSQRFILWYSGMVVQWVRDTQAITNGTLPKGIDALSIRRHL